MNRAAIALAVALTQIVAAPAAAEDAVPPTEGAPVDVAVAEETPGTFATFATGLLRRVIGGEEPAEEELVEAPKPEPKTLRGGGAGRWKTAPGS